MLAIRLQRTGRKNDPSFRVVVTEHTRGPKSEDHVARVGSYNPNTKEQHLDAEAITDWIAKGARPSDTVHNMLIKAGIIKGDTVNVLPQKSPVVSEQVEEEPPASAGESGAEESETEEATPAEAPAEDETQAEDESTEDEQTEKSTEEAPKADTSRDSQEHEQTSSEEPAEEEQKES